MKTQVKWPRKSIMIKSTYLQATNTRGSRIKLTTTDLSHFNNRKPSSVIMPYDHELDSDYEIALVFLKRNKLKVETTNTTSRNHLFLINWTDKNFKQLAKVFKVEVGV